MLKQRKNWILGAMALLTVLLLACIKIGPEEPKVTPIPPTPTSVPPTPTPVPPTPTPVPQAKPEVVKVSLCRGLTDDERPFAETNTFSEADPFVVSIQVAHFKPENLVSARWYQQDAQIGLTERDNVTGNTYVGLTLEPQGQWVPGNYKVEVALDGDLIETQDFSVIGMASLPVPGKGDGGSTTGTMATYRNDELGFSIDYPGDWLVQEANSAVKFVHPQDTAAAFVLSNPDPAGTAEEEAQAVYDALSQNLSSAQQTNSQPQEEGWHGIVFRYENKGTEVVGVLFSKIVGARGYTIVFIAVRTDWEAVVPILEGMWDSLQISGDTPGGTSGADEVLVTGVIKDVDTGRGISNALFVVLKEGVTVQQFVDSGNDKSLIYDAAQSDDAGAFTMNVPMKRGSTYAVIVVAKGYQPVVDDMPIPQDAPDPWQVTVGMQKE